MTQNFLSRYFSLNRRYTRSINLERDVERREALQGYMLTTRSLEALRRIFAGFANNRANCAWTLTSVYGTGKSAFAHFLASLCASEDHPMRDAALRIAKTTLGTDNLDYRLIENHLKDRGLVRAIATAQREPISHTIVRALTRGTELFWHQKNRKKHAISSQLVDVSAEISAGRTIDNQQILELVQEVARTAKTGLLIVIDELGKNLEFASYNEGTEDLYLLQQLTELPREREYPIYLLGILHQNFSEYGQRLASVQRHEWAKIQGRFEDIPFADSAGQMMRLIGGAIDRSKAEAFNKIIAQRSEEWFQDLETIAKAEDLTPAALETVYPLHPIAALVLPILCTRYAQNDRSLFTFITSSEPHSLKNYLDEVTVAGDDIPSTLKLDRVYDYFIEAVGMGFASRINFQRWVEIQGLIADAKQLDVDSLRVLKTIGVLNLVTTAGAVRATRKLVTSAMCDTPNSDKARHWERVIDRLLKKNAITYRRQLDELRIWEGSDFNIDEEVAAYVEQERSPLARILSAMFPLTPAIAQRHSYKMGTLRYFERRYLDALEDLTALRCTDNSCDGLIGYWLDETLPDDVPSKTADGKPLLVLRAVKLGVLRINALELAALTTLQNKAAQLQVDGVARREVQYRLVRAKRLLKESLIRAFDLAANQNVCWILGKQQEISNPTNFNAELSAVCDRIYDRGIVLWNELINRRQLTNQGAKARRELLEAMLERGDRQKLDLQGYGPEVSMYYSLLGETGIHRQEEEEGDWGFYPPRENSGVRTLWQAIEEFCWQASEKQQTLDRLYQQLEAPPYGIKQGAIPVLLAAVLLSHIDDVGVYKDGTFIPVLGSEHFELLVKDPSRFALKYFEVVGLRSQVFKELESILRNPNHQMPPKIRNATLIAVARPLFQFEKKLPAYTRKTKRLSPEAMAILRTLQQAQEPDELLFTSLPQACGLPPIGTGEADDGTTAKMLRKKLVPALSELQTAYDKLLSDCQDLLHEAFGIRSREENLREDLRVRSHRLLGQCIESTLKRFTLAAVDENKANKEWLEALITIVADKPAQSWTDEDVTGFEIRLSDLARRFKNLEALRAEVDAKGGGFEARRITVTHPNGEEINQMVWVERDSEAKIEALVEEILDDLRLRLHNNPQLQQAFVAKLTEKVLGKALAENVAQISDPIQQKHKKL